MSKTIDQKVVQMEFDNHDFEKNVKTSMSTIDKLKQKLNFDSASKGFEDLEKASSKFSLKGFTESVDQAIKKLDFFDVAAYRIFGNIAESAFNAGKSIVSNLMGIEAAANGWQLYATQTTSVQKILSAVSEKINEVTGELYNLEDVKEVVGKVGWYADETSYSLEKMTDSIGSFTGSGIDLKDSETALIGIANAFGDAGINASRAQSGFEGFDKAMGAGVLTLQIWNAQLKTSGIANNERFRQSLIDAAVACGTLEKSVDGLYYTTSKAATSGIEVNIGNIATTLTDGAWATREVMLKTFEGYGDIVNTIYNMYENNIIDWSDDALKSLNEAMIAQGKTAKDLGLDEQSLSGINTTSQAIRMLTSAYKELGVEVPKSLNGFKRAQETVTFDQAIEAVKTSITSGWAKSFEIIFGDLDKATKMWTQLNEDLWNLFASGGERRNDMLQEAFGSKWEEFGKEIEGYGLSLSQFESKFTTFAKAQGIDIDSLISDFGSLEEVLTSGSIEDNIILEFFDTLLEGEQVVTDTTNKLEEFQKVFDDIWMGNYGNGEDRVTALTEAGYDYIEMQQLINDMAAQGKTSGYKLTEEDIVNLSDAQLKNIGYTEEQISTYKELAKQAKETGTPLNELIKSLTKPSGRQLLADSIHNLLQSLVNIKNVFTEAYDEVFAKGKANLIYTLIEYFNKFSKALLNTTEKLQPLKSVLTAVFSIVKVIGSAIGQTIKGGLSILEKIFGGLNVEIGNFAEGLGEGAKSFAEWFENSQIIYKALDAIGDALKFVVDRIKEFINVVKESKVIQTALQGLKDVFGNISGTVKELFDKIKNGSFSFEDISKSFKNSADSMSGTVESMKNNISSKMKQLSEILEPYKDKFKNFIQILIGIGTGYLVLTSFKKMIDAMSTLIAPIASVPKLINAATKSLNSLSGYLKSLSKERVSDAILKISIALAILVGSIYVLAEIDTKALLISVGAVIALLAAMSLLASKLALMQTNQSSIAGLSLIFISFAASLLIIAFALEKVAKISTDGWNSIISMVTLVGLIAVAIVAISRFVKNPINITMTLITLVSMAGMLLVLAIAMKKLSGLSLEQIGKAALGMIVIIVALTSILFMLSKFKTGSFSGGASILLAVASIFLIVMAIKTLADMKPETYVKGILGLIPLLAGLAMVIAAMTAMSAPLKGFAISMIGIAASILLMGFAIEKMGKMNPNVMLKGSVAVAIMLTAITTFLFTMSKLLNPLTEAAGTSFTKLAGVALLLATISATIYVLSGAIMLLGNLDLKVLAKGVGSVATLLLALGASIRLMSKTTFDKQAMKAFIAMIVAIIAMCGSIYLLAGIDSDKLQAATIAMVSMMGSAALLVAALGGVSRLAAGNMSAVLGLAGTMIVIVSAISGILIVLNKFSDAKSNLENAKALLMAMVPMLLGIVAIAAVAELLNGITPGSLAAVGVKILEIEIIIAAMGAVLLGIGALMEMIPDADYAKYLENVTMIAEAIGGFMGSLIGSFTGGIIESVTSVLPKAGECIEAFATHIQKLLDLKIPSDFASTLSSLVDVITTLGSWETQIALSRLADNTDIVTQMSTFFDEFGDAVIKFSNKIKGKVDVASVDAAANAGNMMSALLNSLPSEGNWLSKLFSGDKMSLTEFGKQMEDFGISLSNMCYVVNGIKDPDKAADIAKDCGSVLAEFENSLGNHGGLWSYLAGDNSISSFANNIVAFGIGLRDFCAIMCGGTTSDGTTYTALTGLNSENGAVNMAKAAGETLREFEESLGTNATGGLLQNLVGETGLAGFGSSLKAFAEGIRNFFTILTGDDMSVSDREYQDNKEDGMSKADYIAKKTENAIKIAKTVGEAINEFSETLGNQNEGGLIAAFTGQTGLTGFAQGLKAFGEGLNDFITEIMSIADENDDLTDIYNKIVFFKSIISQILSIGSLTSSDSEGSEDSSGTENLTKIIEMISSFGQAMSAFIENVSEYDHGLVESIIEDIDSFLGLTSSMEEIIDILTENFSILSTELDKLFNDISVRILTCLNTIKEKTIKAMDWYDKSVEAGKHTLEGLLVGLTDADFIARIEAAGRAAAKAFNDAYNATLDQHSPSRKMIKEGNFTMQGLILGLESGIPDIEQSGRNIGNTLKDSLSKSIEMAKELSESELSPVLTPVLDLSEIENETNGLAFNTKASLFSARSASEIQNGANSSNYKNNNVTINLDFSVNNNGNNLDEESISKFSDIIVNKINEDLGFLM